MADPAPADDASDTRLADYTGLADVHLRRILEAAAAEQLTGYRVHRGALASMQRLPLRPVAELLATARRIVVAKTTADPSVSVGWSSRLATDRNAPACQWRTAR